MTQDKTPDKEASAAKAMGRGWKVLLTVSLSVNLLVIGLVLGAVIRHDRGFGGPPSIRDGGNSPLGRALSQEDRDAMRSELRAYAKDKPGHRPERKFREFKAEMLGVLRVEPFDVTALQSVFDKFQQVQQSQQELGEQVLLARIAGMSPADRAAFADRLEKGRGHTLRSGPRKHDN